MEHRLRNQIYYRLKPLLPKRLRLGLRGFHARRIQKTSQDRWPILEAAGEPPEGWGGWPNGAKFAFVLTHDVESNLGLGKVKELAELDRSYGFRSCFNFIPEGPYSVPSELREWLVGEGFEVGVHDHKHDGKLFFSRGQFKESAERINHFLKAWGARGFRSGFMLRNLEWIRDLDIAYDSSTFDTDPFEPDPYGAETVFPFWGGDGLDRRGYVELPYTLAQDSTLFLLLGQDGIQIWQEKIDWIADKGGMVLVNVHPDYLAIGDDPRGSGEYPARHYREMLTYVRDRYAGRYWHALPHEVATHYRESHHRSSMRPMESEGLESSRRVASNDSSKQELRINRGTIWVDLDNTPHVPFFKPIIRELKNAGYQVLVTARDAFQVCDLAKKMQVPCRRIGRHYGKNPLLKLYGVAVRALQLLPEVLRDRPLIGVSHGSRAQILVCNLLRIPSVLIADYEHAKPFPGSRPRWQIVPESLPDSAFQCPPRRGRRYPGLKEDVYAPEFHPDSSLVDELGLDLSGLVVTVRPPANEAHYHNPESEKLFAEVMNRATAVSGARVVLLPRNQRQAEGIRTAHPEWFEGGKTIVPQQAIDGLNLLWHSDLVVSGGGTMNREAAALGVPVYSIFRGRLGAVDRQLEQEGRLVMLHSVAEVQSQLHFVRRQRDSTKASMDGVALLRILAHLEEILDLEHPAIRGAVNGAAASIASSDTHFPKS